MKTPIRHIKAALITGVLIVLPAWLAILLLVQLLMKLTIVVKPITGHLPNWIAHPILVAVALLLLICFFVGLLFHTSAGRFAGRTIELGVLRYIPGYATLRSIAARIGEFEAEHDFQPAFIEVEDGCLTPAFLIETHANGMSTLFVPSVPTPMAGSILIMPSGRVHPANVSVSSMMKCVSKWGAGSGKLLASLPSTPNSPNP